MSRPPRNAEDHSWLQAKNDGGIVEDEAMAVKPRTHYRRRYNRKGSLRSEHVTPRGGNVFADLGFAPEEAEELKVRSDLMAALRSAIRGMTQIKAARRLHVEPTRINELRRGRINQFTIEVLVHMLSHCTNIWTRTAARRARAQEAQERSKLYGICFHFGVVDFSHLRST